MLSSILRLLAIAIVLTAVYFLLELKLPVLASDDQTEPAEVEYSRSNLKVIPRPPTELKADRATPPTVTPRQPYVAVSPHSVIRKSFSDLHQTSSPANRTLSGVIVLHNGAAAANQSISAELILYRPKPDVIFSGVIQTDAIGRFELYLGNEFLSTTSLSLFLGYGSGQNAFEGYASAHVAEVSVEGDLDLGLFLFTPSDHEE